MSGLRSVDLLSCDDDEEYEYVEPEKAAEAERRPSAESRPIKEASSVGETSTRSEKKQHYRTPPLGKDRDHIFCNQLQADKG